MNLKAVDIVVKVGEQILNNIYLIVGESGSGKSTIARILEKKYGMRQLKSYTTRLKRDSTDWNHTFVSNDEFDTLTDMVGYTMFCDNRYCATSLQVDESDTYIIDPAGISYFKENYCGGKGYKVIYIKVDEQVRKTRMRNRKGGVEAANLRILNDKIAFKNVNNIADKIFYNYNLKKCTDLIYTQIKKWEGNGKTL